MLGTIDIKTLTVTQLTDFVERAFEHMRLNGEIDEARLAEVQRLEGPREPNGAPP